MLLQTEKRVKGGNCYDIALTVNKWVIGVIESLPRIERI
jgi:hypothetical protein